MAGPLSTLIETDPTLLDVRASSTGPAGALPLTEELLEVGRRWGIEAERDLVCTHASHS